MIQIEVKKGGYLPLKTAKREEIEVAPGFYDFNEIPNPFGHQAPWIVTTIGGKQYGGAKLAVLQWCDENDVVVLKITKEN